MRKTLFVLLVTIAFFASVGCSGNKQSSNSKAGVDSVRIMVTGSGGGISDWDNNPILKAIEEATNTDIHLEFVEYSGFQELLTVAASSGTFPDMATFLFHGSKTFLQSLVDNGIIAAYEGDVADACPNIIKRYAENKTLDELKIDGKIYFQPLYWGNETAPNVGILHVRKDIIDKYGMKIPDTWDEYVDYLRVCVQKEKIQGAAFMGGSIGDGPEVVMNAYLGSYGIPIDGWFKNESGEYQYWATAKPVVEAVVAFRRLFAEGLMDPNSLSYEEQMVKNAYISGAVGSMIFNGGGHTGRTQNDMALVNPNFQEWVLQAIDCGGGTRGYTSQPMWGQVMVIGGNKYNNPVAAARIVNFLTSEEGEQLTAIGIEGQDFIRENGEIVCLEAKYQHGFPREGGVSGAHPLSAGFVSWQSNVNRLRRQ